MAGNVEATGWSGRLRALLLTIGKFSSKWWVYVGICILLTILNLILGILTMSYLHPKKEGLLFGLICFAVVLALAHFASLCYLIQRVKEEFSDPTYLDAAYSLGIVLLFIIGGLALSVELPTRCYSGPNEHFKLVGRGCCNSITFMAASSWLAALIMVAATTLIFLAARKAIAFSKLPPPVFPAAAEAPIMRWFNRNDPFLSIQSSRRHMEV